MSSIKLTADSGGGTVELKAPATTDSNAAKVLTLPSDETGQIITSDRSGTTLQRQFKYLTSSSQLTSSGAFHELTTDLRIAFTPKAADSNLLMEFYSPFVCPNSTNLQYGKFFDVTNSTTPGNPPASGSKDRVHWTNRNGQFDNNDNDVWNMRIVVPADNTNARTYTVYHRTEGVAIQFFVSTLASAAGSVFPMTFVITEIAA
tara:strand:- start:50 stop:658 length:609 start_codon:yes stop_codon:yes gene_type:complete